MDAGHARNAGPDARTGIAPIRLMIVDDSAVARAVFARMLAARSEFTIVAQATRAEEALELLERVEVDIILLDVEMPGTDGITALPRLLAAARGARVLIVSSACEEGAVATVRALTLGAADTLPKPGAQSFGGRFSDVLADKLIRIARGGSAPGPSVGAPPAISMPDAPIDCLAIGASTGGLHALSAFFAVLRRDFAAPILVTQHLPPVFMPYFALQLAAMAGRPTAVARDGVAIARGDILIAPGDAHLVPVRDRDRIRVRLDRTPSVSGCCPSVDPMLQGLAEIHGPRGVAVILSGMGRDGAVGAETLVAAGGRVLAQDEASSVVWGMPGAVADLAAAVLPPDRIAERLSRAPDTTAWR